MQCRRSGKNVTGVEETLIDRLSELRDSLLIQILSLLPTKDAVTSCALSKRWRYLGTLINNFNFVAKNYENAKSFISFVDHVLSRSKIENFKLDLTYISKWDFDFKISRWLSFAAERKVEYVALCSHDEELDYELPLSMCKCSSLFRLELSCWVFDLGLSLAWNSLKSLKLEYIKLDDDDIVTCCPAVETMELSMFEGFHRVGITSSNLRRLSLAGHLRQCWGDGDSLEIFAPHLRHLEISGNLGYVKIKLVNVSSLVMASLNFCISCITDCWREEDIEEDSCRDYHQVLRDLVLDILQKLSCATELIMGSWLAEGCLYVERPYSRFHILAGNFKIYSFFCLF